MKKDYLTKKNILKGLVALVVVAVIAAITTVTSRPTYADLYVLEFSNGRAVLTNAPCTTTKGPFASMSTEGRKDSNAARIELDDGVREACYMKDDASGIVIIVDEMGQGGMFPLGAFKQIGVGI